MNWLWLVWFAAWSLLAIGSFIALEAFAFKHPDRQNTLSRAVYLLGSKFPLSILIFGFVLGALIFGLGVHFFWHWCPNLMPPGAGG